MVIFRRRRPRLGSDFGRLEDRTVPAQFGIPWPDAQHLTLSFPADGTATPVGPSTATASLANVPGWKREVLRAFQSFAVNTDLNIGLVADGGQPLGSTGAVQGDRRFGDVRVGAAPIADPTEVGFASPFSWTGSTLSGDVLLDSTRPFQVGCGAGGFDVFTVAAHEAGHALGLDHATEAASVLTEGYAFKSGLSAGDVARVQALYGPRTPDDYDAARSNDTPANAVALPKVAGSDRQFTAVGDISTQTDVDYFKLTVPDNTAAVVGRLKVGGTSLLLARYTVVAPNGVVVATGAATDPLSNDLSFRIDNPVAATYTVRLEGATDDVFGVGSYRLVADLTATPAALPGALPAEVARTDGGANDTLEKATRLETKTAADGRFDAVVLAAIESPTDGDYYKLRSTKTTGPLALNLLVWAADGSSLWPAVHVFDEMGVAVPGQVLANDDGTVSLRVGNVTPDKDYYVLVVARAPGSVGGYHLAADFNSYAAPPTGAAATGLVSAAAPLATGGLAVNRAGVFQFGAAATAAGNLPAGGPAGVTVDVVNAAGVAVSSLLAGGNQAAVTDEVFLPAGVYTVRYRYQPTAGAAPSAVALRYQFTVRLLTDPIGPQGSDVTGGTTPPPPVDPYQYDGLSDVPPTGLPVVY